MFGEQGEGFHILRRGVLAVKPEYGLEEGKEGRNGGGQEGFHFFSRALGDQKAAAQEDELGLELMLKLQAEMGGVYLHPGERVGAVDDLIRLDEVGKFHRE